MREVTDVYFGTAVVDPYRWMETDSDELSAWIKGQADFTERALAAMPLHDALHARVHELNDVGVALHSAQRRGQRLFYLKRAPGDEMFKLCVRDADGQERVLVDPASKVTPGQTFSIDYFEPSPDGKLIAYGLSPNGSEMAVLHVVAVADGRELPEVIDRARYAFVSWQPDGHSFFYKRDRLLPAGAPESERMLKARVHLLGGDSRGHDQRSALRADPHRSHEYHRVRHGGDRGGLRDAARHRRISPRAARR